MAVAKDANNVASALTILTVRKGVNRDVIGDGYEDVVVGAPLHSVTLNSYEGRAYVFHSAGSAGVTATAAGSANTVVTGEAGNDLFGSALALGTSTATAMPT
jgi:hypothetical protein